MMFIAGNGDFVRGFEVKGGSPSKTEPFASGSASDIEAVTIPSDEHHVRRCADDIIRGKT
ncbi:hypothetical protein CH339_19900 [Rhodobium orientis]|uniref:Uncharacterized protein n=1 Tax=Rhodobium orientis TaxID=34017 RepID=A0A327JFH6_9HYPH|nr:hypothetical protein [Rhodobium orientis]RAI25069.1 hypothetical protein CH339_19900 [Rhodobium orientis]